MGLIRTRISVALVIGALAGVTAATAGAQSFDELIAKGRAQLDSGKADDAVKTLEKAVKLNPQSADAHFRLGNALGNVAQRANIIRQGFLAKRVKSEFEKSVELDPTQWGPREGLVQFYLQAPGVMGGSVGKAREQAAAIAKISPLRGYFADANIANNQKDLPGMEKAYRAAAREFPDSINAVTSLVSFLSSNGKADEAFAPLDRYLAKKPNDRAGLFWIGRTAAITGKQLDRGEQALRAVLATPETVDNVKIPRENAHYRLGDIYAKRGDKVKARAEYEEALKLNPKLEVVKKALGAL